MTVAIRGKVILVDKLKNGLDKFLNTGLFKKTRTAEEFFEYNKYVAKAESELWEEVYRKYPELSGKSVLIRDNIIKID